MPLNFARGRVFIERRAVYVNQPVVQLTRLDVVILMERSETEHAVTCDKLGRPNMRAQRHPVRLPFLASSPGN